MSQPIPSNQFSHGAGKGPEERPIDRKKYAENFSRIRWQKFVSGNLKKSKNGKSTFVYR
jgi:hypothetical protein